MKIERITFIPHQLKRKFRWQTASYSADKVDLFYVKIETDSGLTGLGAASIMPSAKSDFFQPGLEAVKPAATELFLGQDPWEIDRLMGALDRRVPRYPRHKVALELALYDLTAKAQNVPLSTLFGGGKREKIPVLKMLGMGTPEWMAERAVEFVRRGYRSLKVKLGAGPQKDRDCFTAVRKAVGSVVNLTGDFNGAYDAPTAIKVIESLTAEGLSVAEQPVPAGDLEGMAAVTRAVKPVVLADQSVGSAEDVAKIAALGAARAVSIKLLKLGGIRRAKAVTDACAAAGLVCHVGGTATSRLIEAAQAHVVSATPNILTPAEIGEFEELDGDLAEGLEVENGAVRVPGGPGLGVSLKI